MGSRGHRHCPQLAAGDPVFGGEVEGARPGAMRPASRLLAGLSIYLHLARTACSGTTRAWLAVLDVLRVSTEFLVSSSGYPLLQLDLTPLQQAC